MFNQPAGGGSQSQNKRGSQPHTQRRIGIVGTPMKGHSPKNLTSTTLLTKAVARIKSRYSPIQANPQISCIPLIINEFLHQSCQARGWLRANGFNRCNAMKTSLFITHGYAYDFVKRHKK